MGLKVGINGFGRIGRMVFKASMAKGEDFEVVAVNDLTDAKTLAHLLKYDSVHGKFPGEVSAEGNCLVVNGKKIEVTAVRNPEELEWDKKGVDVVIESTGVFRKKEQCAMHLKAGAKKVILTVPPKDEIDNIIVLGVNQGELKAEDNIISNASCTTNCLAPMVKVLNDAFGIKDGLMTTIHSYTNDQAILDLPHADLRRARAAAVSMIPTTTGAAAAVGKVIPALAGKLNGCAVRVPTPNGSLTDFVARLEKDVTAEDVNAAMKKAAEGELKGILEYTDEPLVSCDIIDNPHSCVFDSLSTMVMEGNLVKVLGWYDNEWGYSNRVVDLAIKAAAL